MTGLGGQYRYERERKWVMVSRKGKKIVGVYVETRFIPGESNPDGSGRPLPVEMVAFGLFRRKPPEGKPDSWGQEVKHEKLRADELIDAAELIAFLRRECAERKIPLVRGNDELLKRG